MIESGAELRARVEAVFARTIWPSAGVIIILGTLARLHQLTHSLNDAYGFRQTQVAFVVREYARSGIDLLRTPLPVFGPNADVPMEMPLFQAVASLLTHLGFDSSVASRTLGLLSFQASAILLVVLVNRWHGRTAAIAAVALFEFLPFGLQWGASSMIDFFAVALALAMVAGLDRWFAAGGISWLVLGSVGAVLAFLAKVTTVPSWGILLLVSSIVAIRQLELRQTWKRQLVGYAIGPGLGLAGAFWWTSYADSVKSSKPLTQFLTSSALREWNFGTLDQRLDLSNWIRIGDRVFDKILGVGLILIVATLVLIVWSRPSVDRIRFGGWIFVVLSGPLIFFNLYWVHDYYLMAVYPALVTLAGVSIAWVCDRVSILSMRRAIVIGVAVAAMFISTALTELGEVDVGNFRTSSFFPAPSAEIIAGSAPGDLIIVTGCDWDPTVLYSADRKGVMFRRGAPVAAFWALAAADDYRYLYSCNTDLEPNDYLPDGYSAVASEQGARLFKVLAVASEEGS